MKHSLYLLFSVLVLASVVLTACGPAATPVPPTAAPVAKAIRRATPEYDGEIS